MIRPRLVAVGLLLAVLGSCVPSATEEGGGPSVALINAPAQQRVAILADALQAEIERLASCCRYTFVRSQPVRFQETHRDLFGSRAVPQAAALARNLGADLAVMAGAPRFERVVEEVDGSREVRAVVQLRATVLDVNSGEALGSVGSLTFRDRRPLQEDEELPEIAEDPLMVELTDEAVADLAPHLAALLDDLAKEQAAEQVADN